MRLLTVVGNRPQFIKSAPLSGALREAGIEEVVVHTGQHWDPALSAVFFDELALAEPAVTLDLRTSDVTAIEAALREIIEAVSPDTVLVYGDTNSTLAGARACWQRVPVAHVEAGLRSGDLDDARGAQPDRGRPHLGATSSHPTSAPARRSAAERVEGEIHVVGDVMADATARFAPLARRRSRILRTLGLEPQGLRPRDRSTARRTCGRSDCAASSTGSPARHSPVVLPAHPRTRGALAESGIALPRTVHGRSSRSATSTSRPRPRRLP